MIEEQKHTPGPWEVEQGYSGSRGQIAVTNHDNFNRTGCCICLIAPVSNYTEEDKANARLIAAAPDMLAALEKLDEMRKDFFIPDDELGAIDGDSIRAFVEMYRAAISKAKGAQ